jgi:hypothetical protein
MTKSTCIYVIKFFYYFKKELIIKETKVKYLATPDTGGGAFGATYVLWNLPLL